MHDSHNHSTEDFRRCQAITTKGRRCRKKAEYYRIYKDDLLDVCCNTHLQDFRPHPSQKGQEPPREEW